MSSGIRRLVSFPDWPRENEILSPADASTLQPACASPANLQFLAQTAIFKQPEGSTHIVESMGRGVVTAGGRGADGGGGGVAGGLDTTAAITATVAMVATGR
jgi:hypothetical protein